MDSAVRNIVHAEVAKRESPFWQLSHRQQELLARHLELVIDRNHTVNLTRITAPDEAVYLHIYDSLLLVPALMSAPDGAFVDIGTGAGFPGIPLAIATEREAVLIDSVGKKVAAVQDFVRELGLEKQIRVVQVRAEDLARAEGGSFSAVCARAVAQTNVLVEYAAPLLKRGGRALIAKARPTEAEISAGDAASKICGLRRVSRETFDLPHELGHREVFCYERVAKSRIRLPRPVGTAAHKPLGV